MEMMIDVPERVVEEAARLGVTVTALISGALAGIGREPLPPGFKRLGEPTMTAKQAGAAMREIASKHTLDGLRIKDLIEEGRRL